MESASRSATSPTLLGRLLDPTDQAAWPEFVARYGPKIQAWCRHWKLQEADVDDVTQNVLLLLAQKMRTFTYDPARSFRAWLKTLTRHALSDFRVSQQRAGRGSGDSQVGALLESLPARDDLESRLDAEFDRELLEAAVARVRLQVKPSKWEAYRLTALDGQSGAAAAAELGLAVATVFNYKSQVHKLLQVELQRLNGPSDVEEHA